MSGWLTVEILQGKDIELTNLLRGGKSFIGVQCPMVAGEGKGSFETPKMKGKNPYYATKEVMQTKKEDGEITIELREDALIGSELKGSHKINVSRKGDGLSGSTWFNLGKGTVFVKWNSSFSPVGNLFASTAEVIPPPPPQTDFAMGLLQAEIGRVSGHGYNLLLPYWWLNERWTWSTPYESMFVLLLGSLVFYYNVFHWAFPLFLFLCLMKSYYIRVRYGPAQEEIAALGFLDSVGWVNETLQVTQTSLTQTNDTLDSVSALFTWENQPVSKILTFTMLGCLLAHFVGLFPSWNYIFLLIWVYLFTYFPLSVYAPQLYTALLPQNFIFSVVKLFVKPKGFTTEITTDDVLPIRAVCIPTQDEVGGSVKFKIMTTFTDGRPPAEVRHRYSEFDFLKQRLALTDPTLVVKGFPGKTAFKVKGEALNARRRDLELWLNQTVVKSNTSRGAPLRSPIFAFLTSASA